jgi:hypothetical protein
MAVTVIQKVSDVGSIQSQGSSSIASHKAFTSFMLDCRSFAFILAFLAALLTNNQSIEL